MQTDVAITDAFKAAVFYEQFLVPGIFIYWTPLLLSRASPQSGEKVLDLACGTGVVARQMVPLLGDRGTVVGLDINPKMLAVACQQFSDYCNEIIWQEGQAENIPFPDHEFDLVTCQQGLQFFRDRTQAMKEVHRILKPGGRAVLEVFRSVECSAFFEHVYEVLASQFEVPFADLTTAFGFGEPEDMNDLLVQTGFHDVIIEELRQEVLFSDPSHFVEKIIKSVSAVLPVFARINDSSNSNLIQDVQDRLARFIKQHTQNGMLTFPMFAIIATAFR